MLDPPLSLCVSRLLHSMLTSSSSSLGFRPHSLSFPFTKRSSTGHNDFQRLRTSRLVSVRTAGHPFAIKCFKLSLK
eukprot:m.355395 g.355395  ORF g.355395 m.355395 type:complete len:76 (-) comp17241_c0_seq1:25-252(-)